MRVDEVAADHDACSAFASLAVDGYDVVLGLRQESVHVLAEIIQVGERRRLMIIEPELLRDFEEVSIGVGALCAQVVYLIAALVLEFKEGLDVLHMIPVNALEAL